MRKKLGKALGKEIKLGVREKRWNTLLLKDAKLSQIFSYLLRQLFKRVWALYRKHDVMVLAAGVGVMIGLSI